MLVRILAGVTAWLATVIGATTWSAPQNPQNQQRARGALVTFERVLAADSKKQVQTQHARLMSLAVERGETPTPFVEPGMFKATYRTTLVLPARDRFRFRVEGRGKVE